MSKFAAELEANPFDPALIEKLEGHLQQQVSSGTYDFEANKALLKLYDTHPAKRSDHMTALIVTKALMNLPATDAVLCMYLIPEELRLKEPIRDLVRYSEALDAAQFVEFWEMANLGGNELLDNVPGFAAAIRAFIVGVLANTFQKLEADAFMDLLALDAKHIGDFVAQQPAALGMALEGKLVVFGPNPSNQPRPKTVKEAMSFESMLPVLRLLSGS